jgi:hypothetical protein
VHDENAGRNELNNFSEIVSGDLNESANEGEAVERQYIEDDDFVYCPVDGCGEALLLTELEAHVEMHEEEQGDQSPDSDDVLISEDDFDYRGSVPGSKASFDTKLSYALRNLEDVDVQVHEKNERSGRKQASKNEWGQILKIPEKKRTRRRSRSTEKGRIPGFNAGGKQGRRLGVSD